MGAAIFKCQIGGSEESPISKLEFWLRVYVFFFGGGGVIPAEIYDSEVGISEFRV